ncbi:hypothetical protein LTR37_020823 [Vermiconidia calcicola]|uniref:Uncharacterized protein n=1 Tax=Vermiconidia calcicola TaxID=1690605 RepID=A0ACC3MC78_9PEZI|nr:hypothetical protein LTR37_020823 [Vermiconidia calcicola]
MPTSRARKRKAEAQAEASGYADTEAEGEIERGREGAYFEGGFQRKTDSDAEGDTEVEQSTRPPIGKRRRLGDRSTGSSVITELLQKVRPTVPRKSVKTDVKRRRVNSVASLPPSKRARKQKADDTDVTAQTKTQKSQGRKKIYWASHKHNTPASLLKIPFSEAWKLNLEQRGLPAGELEAKRTPGAIRISWLVDYPRPGATNPKPRIFFYNHDERYGGPFGFLSNFYKSSFMVQDVATNVTWHSVEQFYQHCKGLCIAIADEKFSDFTEPPLSSKDLACWLTVYTDPNECAKAGRSFNEYMKSDPEWWNSWNLLWNYSIQKVLFMGLLRKFEENPQLAVLLLMTGDFELVEAAENDGNCGILCHASQAMEEMSLAGKWIGHNFLGSTLMQVRNELRKSSGLSNTPSYAFDFWRLWEETCNNERYNKHNTTTKRVAINRDRINMLLTRYRRQWLRDHNLTLPRDEVIRFFGRLQLETIDTAEDEERARHRQTAQIQEAMETDADLEPVRHLSAEQIQVAVEKLFDWEDVDAEDKLFLTDEDSEC